MENLFAQKVIAWYQRHGRSQLPWKNQSLYHTWISEIMLQQTQVATVIPYYQRFISTFPDILSLAEAPIDEVLYLWSGLGYYARARNLHKAAKQMVEQFGSAFPRQLAQLQSLPGIGRSTAGAVLSLALGERHAILDGNVKRILSRYFGVDGAPGQSSTIKRLWMYSERVTPERQADHFNQAMMDLGAMICRRGTPSCENCPLQSDCFASKNKAWASYPAPRALLNRPIRTHWFVMVVSKGCVWLEKNSQQTIWHALYSFPAFEAAQEAETWIAQLERIGPIERYEIMTHELTHCSLAIHPWLIRLSGEGSMLEARRKGLFYSLKEPQRIGIAAPIKSLIGRYLQSFIGGTDGS